MLATFWARSRVNELPLVLGLIALIAAVPRLLLGASQFIEYDGYWHIFIARQGNWHVFWTEIEKNAHPPLFFLLLKLVVHFGSSRLLYRGISLLTGIAAVFLVGWIAHKVTRSALWAYQTALVYGLALPGIVVSCEVRSYMLSVFFILLSFSYLLDLAVTADAHRQRWLRFGFAAAAMLACLSHYFAFFYSGAAMLFLIRHKASLIAKAATILPLLAVMAALFWTHVHLLAKVLFHLLPYYYDPHGNETIASFLVRNVKNLVNLFSPFAISSERAALSVGILGLLAGLLLLGFLLRSSDAADARASWTILITLFMLAGMAMASIAGKYPFGGDLRQQFILFPFLVLCAGILADRLSLRLLAKSPLLLNGAIALLVIAASFRSFEKYPKIAQDVLKDRMDLFDRMEPSPAAVYLDQFSLIAFFTFHDTWEWSLIKQRQPEPEIDTYRLRRGSQQMLLFRDQSLWNLDPADPAVYGKLAACLRAAGVGEVSVFCARQNPPETSSDVRTISDLAAHSSLCVQRLIVNPFGWYGTFRESRCTPLKAAGPEVQYIGPWNNGSFPSALHGAVSYSNIPGSAARLTFEGTEVTYIYTAAFNRGIAVVTLDGRTRRTIDLFHPGIVWQSRATFDKLASGVHRIEVTVSGRKNPASSDRYVDVEGFLVR